MTFLLLNSSSVWALDGMVWGHLWVSGTMQAEESEERKYTALLCASCVYGQCGTKGDAFTLCRSLQAYASLCARAGQVLTWRSSTFCRE